MFLVYFVSMDLIYQLYNCEIIAEARKIPFYYAFF